MYKTDEFEHSVVDLNPWHICSFAPKTLIITLRYDTKMIKHCVSSLAKYKCIKLYAWRACICIALMWDICVSKVWRWHCIHNHKYSVCHLKSQTFTNVCIYLVSRRLLMQSLLKLKMQWVNNQKPNDSRDSAHLSAQNALVFVYRLHLSKANTFFRKYTCFSLSHSLWLRISCSPQSSYIADTHKHTHIHTG